MRIEELEPMRKYLGEMVRSVTTVHEGSKTLKEAIMDLTLTVEADIKHQLWMRYLEENHSLSEKANENVSE